MDRRTEPTRPSGRPASLRPVSLSLLAVLAALLPAGCASPVTPLRIEPSRPFVGPEARFETLGRNHIVVFKAPTGGWSVRHDQTLRQFRIEEVYITLEAPGPGVAVTQALVDHAVDTVVESNHNVAVYARILTGRKANDAAPYLFVGEVIPNPPAR